MSVAIAGIELNLLELYRAAPERERSNVASLIREVQVLHCRRLERGDALIEAIRDAPVEDIFPMEMLDSAVNTGCASLAKPGGIEYVHGKVRVRLEPESARTK